MPNKPSKKAISFHQFLQKVQQALSLSEQRLKESSFYIYRTDTHQVLARDVDGFDAAKEKANRLRHQLGLKWDQVKFKAERNQSANSSAGSYGTYRASTLGGTPKGRVDYSKNYNPSKRGRFRGYYDKQGNYHDLD